METTVTPVALAVWAHHFATMLNAGVSLMRALVVLQEASDEPLASVTRQMAERIEAGATLSQSMMDHPEVFNRLSISLCRAGEVGGVIDETFALWTDWLERDLEFRARLDMYLVLARFQRAGRTREELEAELRAALPDLDDRVQAMTFCRLFGMMLGSGVPILQALEVAATEVYPDGAERSHRLGTVLREAKERGVHLGRELNALGYPSVVVQLATIGEECGTLDRMMEKAADLFQRELEIRLSAAMAGIIDSEAAS